MSPREDFLGDNPMAVTGVEYTADCWARTYEVLQGDVPGYVVGLGSCREIDKESASAVRVCEARRRCDPQSSILVGRTGRWFVL